MTGTFLHREGVSGIGLPSRSKSFSRGLTERIPPYSFTALLLALACIAVATIARGAFGIMGASLLFATYFPAVLVAALLAGTPAAIVVIVGSILTVWGAFLSREHAFGPLDATQQINMALFLVSSGCIAALAHWHREVLRRLGERERERELIMQELEHRGRNTYSIIEAIIKKTMEDDPTRAEAITGRIRAVKYTNDLINGSASHRVLLKSLFRHEFAPYGNSRIEIDGEDIELPPDTARQLALVFHELVTNAAKYGSLSRPGGRVLVSWRGAEGKASLQWKEEGGPPVVPPSRHSFGSKLVTQCLKSLSGSILPTFAPEGLRCEITFRI